MSEINKLPNFGNQIDKIKPKKFEQQDELENTGLVAEEESNAKEIPAGLGVGGRSQVKQTGLDADLKFLNDNPELVKESVDLGDQAYKYYEENGVDDAGEKAAAFTVDYADEMLAK